MHIEQNLWHKVIFRKCWPLRFLQGVFLFSSFLKMPYILGVHDLHSSLAASVSHVQLCRL